MLENIDCRHSLEPHYKGGSNEYHNFCFEQTYKKNICVFFYLKIFSFFLGEISIYMNRRVFFFFFFFVVFFCNDVTSDYRVVVILADETIRSNKLYQ